MALHKLVLDEIEDVDFSLLAIHCAIEDFRIAYLLNKHLNLRLERKSKDLDFAFKKATFSLFEWKDEEQMITWNLISNVCKVEEEGSLKAQSLFDVPNKIMRTHNFIPEYKNVNYFLKIYNDGNYINDKGIINTILQIPHVVTAYSVDVTELKSKDNLIFI